MACLADVCVKSVKGTRLSIPEIAEEIAAPVAFTAKILQTLAREGIISSSKGPNGGFFIDPKSKTIPFGGHCKSHGRK
jgi:Rrf2 family transcriptional regulator, iron-sulfur cluster assembly transcription factor